MKKESTLYIFSNGRVAALRKTTGDIIWEVKLKDYIGTASAYNIGQIVQEEDKLFVSVAGHVVCLRTKDGSLVWKNDLKGWGYYFVSMTGANVLEEAEASKMAAAATVMITSTT